ncbi:hypothetical protein [Burkholderia seminalis]|uniref:hypothetical protein n=1 Tax=Burkholderia seminalis TaxID=488731 RepID=UPI0026528B74|nr:hypothetical protein [Burkholderia seminalis]MDN7592097.1 hypothetical protein [Burkholderia seminalis]
MREFSVMSTVYSVVTIALVVLILMMSAVLCRVISAARADTSIENGYPALAEVVEIRQTGVTFNQVPLMRMVLRIQGNPSREVTIRQYVDLGNMPRLGERVWVMVDKIDPSRVTYTGLTGALP